MGIIEFLLNLGDGMAVFNVDRNLMVPHRQIVGAEAIGQNRAVGVSGAGLQAYGGQTEQ